MLAHKDDRATLVEFDLQRSATERHDQRAQRITPGLIASEYAARGLWGHPVIRRGIRGGKNLLANEKGRKAMVILSDGGDNGSHHSLAEAIEQAQRADVQIYSILYSMFNNYNGNSGIGPASDAGPGSFTEAFREHGWTSPLLSLATTACVRFMRRLDRICGCSTSSATSLRPDTQPNSYHKLELKTKEKKLIVQARKGFFEPP